MCKSVPLARVRAKKKKLIRFSHFLSFSSWAENQINRDRLMGENQNFNTRARGILISLKIPDSEATLGI